MSSIPLPALGVQAPQQPDTLGNFQKLLAIKQQQAMAPLQQQEAQQQVQSGALDVQQKQQQLKDQQAITAAMQQWDGKDYNALYPLVTKNGGSGTAVIGLKQKALEQQKSLADIAEKDATTGSKNIETMKAKNDMVAGALQTVMSQPDENIAQALTQTAQELANKGLIDPQHAQGALQLAQSGDPAKIRQQLDIIRKGSMAQSQITEEALKKAQTEEAGSRANEADVNAQKTTQEMQMGGTGAMAESRYRNILMNQKLGRPVNAEDEAFKSAYEKSKMLVPTATINLQSGLLNDQAKQMAADMYKQTGQLPAGMRSPAMSAGVLNEAAKGGSVNIAANKANYAADTDSLKNLQKQFDAVSAFESTANKNIEVLKSTLKDIPDLGSRFANVPARMLADKLVGTPSMAKYKTALATVQSESAKILNSANASGVLSDSARHELQDIVDGNATIPAMLGSLSILQRDFGNRHQSYSDQISTIKGRLGGHQESANPPAQQDAHPFFGNFGGTVVKK